MKKNQSILFVAALMFLLIVIGLWLSRTNENRNENGTSQVQKNKGTVNIYSYRQEFLIRPLLDDFTEKTGIQTKIVFLEKGLLERLKIEGRNSPADIVLTADVGRFKNLKEAGLLQPITSQTVLKNIPQKYRDAENEWLGLTTRARIIYASRQSVGKDVALTYESLADPRWKGKICIRSGYHQYNIALLSSLIAHHGEAFAENWLKGLKSNLAHKPQGNDRTQIKAIKEGLCEVSIGNSYYYGKMLFNDENPEQKDWAKAVRLIFPNQATQGTHMNISGVALTRYAPNEENALKFLEYLSSDEAQFIYSEVNFEFPVKPSIPKPSKVKALSENFKEDTLKLQAIIDHYNQTVLLLDKVDFDNP